MIFCIFAACINTTHNNVALIQSYEKSGSLLFKYRGQIPVIIFLITVPLLFFTNETLYWQLSSGRCQTLRIVMTILALAISLSGLALRAYTVSTTPKGTSGRNTSKQVADRLNTTGIYSVVRHPLYLANYLIWAGMSVFTMNISIFLIVSLFYWVYYERIMFAEEAFLRQQFGEQFETWAAKVPAFIPRFSLFKSGNLKFSFKTFVRREYATWFSTVFSYTAIDYLMYCAMSRTCDSLSEACWLRPSLIVLAVSVVVVLTIKCLKHCTSLLQADSSRD